MKGIEAKQIEDFEQTFRTTSIIVWIQIFATVILIITGWFLAAIIDNSVSQRAINLMWVAIILLVASSLFLRRVLFSPGRLKQAATELNIQGFLKLIQNKTVFLSFFGLFIAIIGFLVATLSGNSFEMLRAGTAAMVVFFFNFPKKEIWKKIISNLFDSFEIEN